MKFEKGKLYSTTVQGRHIGFYVVRRNKNTLTVLPVFESNVNIESLIEKHTFNGKVVHTRKIDFREGGRWETASMNHVSISAIE